MKEQLKNVTYTSPKVLAHQSIVFEPSQSWNEGHGPVSNDPGDSNGNQYPNGAYDPKKQHPWK